MVHAREGAKEGGAGRSVARSLSPSGQREWVEESGEAIFAAGAAGIFWAAHAEWMVDRSQDDRGGQKDV
ncbi:hypothetical protein MYX04_09100 [Nitrospiraceae bacterium AH_259_D15_M11_P09]|nr:hypothetical protein [Nitrospiraceae bacterium AH_259_D15_M11_P09]